MFDDNTGAPKSTMNFSDEMMIALGLAKGFPFAMQ